MYTSFFGLHEKPFSITPDPRYLFMSERHAEALAHLLYGVREAGGFIQLTGEVGTGKTTLLRSLLQQLPENADVALILNPQISRTEFLAAICEELKAPLPELRNSVKALVDALNRFLLENHSRGRKTILIVDEAQNLRLDVLEQVRLLTNLETAKQKLLQIILTGQPELRVLLARNDMRQLAQRITGRYHLEPLSRVEAEAYIDHRVKVAGGVGRIFAEAARREIYRLGHGIPRMMNVIADRALLGAFAAEASQVTPAIVRQAAAEVYDRPVAVMRPWSWRLGVAAVVLAAIGAATLGGWWLLDRDSAQVPIEADAATEPPVEEEGPVVVALASLGNILDGLAHDSNADAAYERLFALWDLPYAAGSVSACQQAQSSGLRCLLQRGTFKDIAALNTPVILTLRSHTGISHQAVLKALEEDSSRLILAGREFRVATSEIADFWQGEYLLLWRPQTAQVKVFVPGMRDPDIPWLRSSLASIQGSAIEPMASDVYDADLEARVRQYQQARRLNADGMVSQQTQVAIIADLAAIDMPRLAGLR